jgi:hypothetical protein
MERCSFVSMTGAFNSLDSLPCFQTGPTSRKDSHSSSQANQPRNSISTNSAVSIMCFYSVIDYTCGDWKWGNMRERCPKQHRMGEHCDSIRLPHHETSVRMDQPCSTCKALAVKHRRLDKSRETLQWRKRNGPKDFQHSIAKAQQEIEDLLDDIAELEARRPTAKLAKSRGSCGSRSGVKLPRMEYAVSTGGYDRSQYGSIGQRVGW